MYIQIQLAKWQVYYACQAIDDKESDIEVAVCVNKIVSSDIAMKVTVDAIQIFGGYGYVKDYPVEKRMRDAKVMQIYEGTNQILKNIFISDLLKD